MLVLRVSLSQNHLLKRILKLSPSDSHTFKTVSQELCLSIGTSQRTAAVHAKTALAARLSLSTYEVDCTLLGLNAVDQLPQLSLSQNDQSVAEVLVGLATDTTVY